MSELINKTTIRGFKEAKRITKRHSKTFYFASRFLPKEEKYAAYAVYAMCRLADDSAGIYAKSNAEHKLVKTKEYLNQVYSNNKTTHSLLIALRETVNKYQIPKEYFDQLIEGMCMDLYKNHYKDFNELYTYCYKVASIVGLIMLKILRYDSEEAQYYAVDLGIAMQLTNIIRDIKEDFNLRRVYLPFEEMRKFSITDKNISNGIVDENFIDFMKFQIYRARTYYKDGTEGIGMISDPKSRFVVLLIKEMYSEILTVIERNGYDIFSDRTYVNLFKKVLITIKVARTLKNSSS